MTGREKIAAALSPEGSPEFAAVTCYQGLFLRDHWEQATDAPWWAAHDPDPERAARPWVEMLQRTGEDWFPVRYGATRQARADTSLTTTDEQVWKIQRRTGERTLLHRPPVGGVQPAPGQVAPGAAVRDADELDVALTSVYGPPPQAGVTPDDGSLDLPRLLLRELGVDRMPLAHVPAPWWWSAGLWGYDGLMLRMVETPELVRQASERLLAHCLHLVARYAAAGVGLVWIEDCLSDMISPVQCREFSLTYVRPLCEAIRAAGMLSVHYYCGRPDDRWEYLLDTGADALALEEGKKGFVVDIVEVAKRVEGRMALLGNLDAIAVLEHGSDATLRAEVARQIEAGKRNRGRFVVSIGSPVTPGTPLARVRRYCGLVHELSGE